ncbi:hypothetical protein G6O69_10560 [Pseudenhygromyxa sp. WMMC2535]|uniref:hypothetical protein n=1 Tax=Pseudenhygromyxa sp. WMMC2535 TaxID=2712867 RepID=UPI0015955225|nr:hypothetical protein [Pseudenhygromyxa sp. WMMC2535]NVB38273.1 hypothetical protein [Pseudenhygromyxa sp. WMMC2535]
MISTTFARIARRATLLGAMGTLLLGAGSCVDTQEYITIDRSLWFDEPDTCLLTDGNPTPVGMMVDVAVTTRIGIGLVVTNQLTENSGSNTNIDDSQVRVVTAEITLSMDGGAVGGGTFEVSLPSNTLAGGASGIYFVQVGSEISDELRSLVPEGEINTMEMTIVLIGERTGTVGKTEIGFFESAPYTYPFDICNGCATGCGFSNGFCGYSMAPVAPLCANPVEETDTETDTDTGP